MNSETIGGRYQILDRIGVGGVAVVYVARDLMLGRLVAIKMLTPAAAADPAFATRFRREAKAIASLNHPNIVTVYDWGTANGTDYMVMERLPGGNLAELLTEKSQLPEVEALRIARDIALGLARAHGEGIVHRDIKPHNVLLDAAGNPKLADFGIAHAPGLTHLTQTNAVVGTASYISPEQAQGQEAGERSDLYSLGIVLYEMLTGRPPFQGESLVDVAVKHVHEAPIPPRQRRPELSPETDAAVLTAIAKDPADRFQSAAEMAAALGTAEAAAERRPLPAPSQLAATAAGAAIMSPNRTTAHPRVEHPASSSRAALIAIPLAMLAALLVAVAVMAHPWVSTARHTAYKPKPTVVHVAARTKATPSATARAAATATPAPTTVPTRPATAPPLPTATAGPPAPAGAGGPQNHGAGNPVAAVVRFYTLIAEHRFAEAAALWTPSMQSRFPPNVDIVQRFSRVQSIYVNARQTALDPRAGTATVAVSLTEVDQTGTQRLAGSWQLVNQGSGWLLNQPDFPPPNASAPNQPVSVSAPTPPCGKSDHGGCGSPPPHGHDHGKGNDQ
ncbi:MAG TPA: protein kinase [Chloroflexota bacterium]|nr:protein kinase [Chloroflexota bacterium]